MTVLIEEHTDRVTSVAFSPDSKTLAYATCGDSSANFSCTVGDIYLWNLATRMQIGEPLEGHTYDVWSIAFSPDGRTLASGSTDRTIILWDIASYQPIGQSLKGYVRIGSVAFSPEGQVLVTPGINSLVLWNVGTVSLVESSCQRGGRNFTREDWAKYFPNDEYRKTCEQWP